MTSPRDLILANAKLPKKLAERIDALRDDEELRENLERSVYDTNRERMNRRPPPPRAPPPANLTPRQKLQQRASGIGGVIAKAAAAPAPAAQQQEQEQEQQQEPEQQQQQQQSRRTPRESKPTSSRTSKGARQASSPRGALWANSSPPASPGERGATPVEAPMPPLELPYAPPPPPGLAPWAMDLIEKSRGHRARDPLEVGGSAEANLVRRRQKGLEIGGVFRMGMSGASQAERLTDFARAQADAGPLEGPPDMQRPGGAARLESVSWLSGDFVTRARIADPLSRDSALLSSHRAPYVDPAKRPTGRQRDRGNEIASSSYRTHELSRLSPRQVSDQAWRGIRLPPEAYPLGGGEGEGDGQLDFIEMATARSLISTSLASARRQRGRI